MERIITGRTLNQGVSSIPGQETAEAKEPVKEIAVFSNPKTVKKKTPGSILMWQAAVCGGFLGLLLILKLTVPQLYQNISMYLEQYIIC